ncbi:MAG: aconitase/3-isopropylmalate dehydratase large subunit family protein [bacterium]
MGQTIAEKILSAHAGAPAKAGDLVVAEIDYVMLGDAKGPKAVDIFREAGFPFRLDPKKTDFVIDHFVPAFDVRWAEDHVKLREFASERGLNLFDCGEGVCHTLVTDEGRVGPGDLVVGGDSHVCTYGALNTMAVAVESGETASVFATGKLWFRVPETIRVLFEGDLPEGVFAKDVALALAKEIGVNGANYKALEYGGPALGQLSMEGRFTIANMAVDTGAKTGVMEADEDTLAWARGVGRESAPVAPDADAIYEKTIRLDVSTLAPVVAAPPTTNNVYPIGDYAGLPVHQAFVGTCTNGRLEDIEIAAQILRGRKVAKGVRFYVSPTSRKIMAAAAASGAIQALNDAGAVVLISACGPCVSMTGNGIVAAGERVITSANRNFPGRLGSKEAEIFLGSPATVAASAVAGKITDPREILAEVSA